MLKRSGPFSEESHRELVKPRVIVEPEQGPKNGFGYSLYALGWEVDTYRGRTVIGHDGGMPGFCSLMRYLPDHDWGFVVLGNSNGAAEVARTLFWSLVDE